MDFKEKYQKELDNINIPATLNQKILNSNLHMNSKQQLANSNSTIKKVFKSTYLRYATAAIICIAILGIITNFNTISTIAKSLFGTFKVIVGDEEFDFGEMETIEFDFESFKKNGAVKPFGASSDEVSLWKNYLSYEECIEETNLPITIINNAYIDDIGVHADSDGHWVRTFISGTYDNCHFSLNGRAETTGSTLESWGFGDTHAKVLEVYEYSDGNKAYILDDDTSDTPCAVGITVQIYFQHNCFLQQLYITGETQEEAIQAGKELLKDIKD